MCLLTAEFHLFLDTSEKNAPIFPGVDVQV